MTTTGCKIFLLAKRASSLAIFFAALMFVKSGTASAQAGLDLSYEDPDHKGWDVQEVDEIAPDEPVGQKGDAAKDFTDIDDDDEAFAPDETEVRAMHHYGVGVGYGRVAPWQTLSLAGHYLYRPNIDIIWSSGTDGFNTKGNYKQKSYFMKLRARSSAFLVNYYFSHVFKLLFASAGVGYADWRGTVTPRGADSDQAVQEQEQLRASFNGHGMFFGVGGGLAKFWKNGLYLSVSLFGLEKSFILAKDGGFANKDSEDVFRQSIQSPVLWGFTNITAAWFF
jgi:hypothetical protein